MEKIYILDTNVLLHDPKAITNFSGNKIIIPIYVIEEIDKLKKNQNEIGKIARYISRLLDSLREKGSLIDGVKITNDITLKVATKGSVDELPSIFNTSLYDNNILALVYHIHLEEKEKRPVIFVTKDINLRIKADALGIKAQDYETNKVNIDELYSGNLIKNVSEELVNKFYKQGFLELGEVFKNEEEVKKIYGNQFITLVSEIQQGKQCLTKYCKSENKLIKLEHSEDVVWGIFAQNREQRYAFEILLDPKIKLVTLVGKAGTGKTLIALAAGLEQVIEKEELYNKLFVARSIMPMGKDIGYLPGDEKTKLKPWIQPIYDNFDFLTSKKFEKENGEKIFRDYENKKLIKVEALTYIRGRSIPNEIMIIDEAQNLTSHEIKTIVTRVGEDTKIIFTGDLYQIDNPYLDENTNGLSYLVDKFKDQEMAGHITLIKGERSELAEVASRIL